MFRTSCVPLETVWSISSWELFWVIMLSSSAVVEELRSLIIVRAPVANGLDKEYLGKEYRISRETYLEVTMWKTKNKTWG